MGGRGGWREKKNAGSSHAKRTSVFILAVTANLRKQLCIFLPSYLFKRVCGQSIIASISHDLLKTNVLRQSVCKGRFVWLKTRSSSEQLFFVLSLAKVMTIFMSRTYEIWKKGLIYKYGDIFIVGWKKYSFYLLFYSVFLYVFLLSVFSCGMKDENKRLCQTYLFEIPIKIAINLNLNRVSYLLYQCILIIFFTYSKLLKEDKKLFFSAKMSSILKGNF